MKIFQWIEKKLYRLDGSTFNIDNDIINRQRRFVLRSTTGIIVAGAMLNLAGLTGIDAFRIPNIVFLAITLTSYFLTRHGKLSLLAGLYVVFMAALSDLSGEMLYLCFSGNKEITYYILADCILYAALMAMTIVTYMPITTVISFCMGGICYGIICVYAQSDKLADIFIILLLLYTATVILSFFLKRNIMKMMEETQRLKDDEKTILDFFQMDKTQILSYIQLANKRGLSAHETNMLLNSFSEGARQEIIDNVTTLINQRKGRIERLHQALPELSQSELEIASLIVVGKKLKDICLQLKKTESNVTCQRTNIRRKMGLKKGDDLYEALIQRIQ